MDMNNRFRIFFSVVDESMEAEFLDHRERTKIIGEVAYNDAGTEPTDDPFAVEKARRLIVEMGGIPRKLPEAVLARCIET